MKKVIYNWLLCAAGGMLLASCTKESVNSNGKNPYGDPVLPAISFAETNAVVPVKGNYNDEVVLRGKGFLANKDKLQVMFNGTPGQIIALTDTAIKVKVPELASTGTINVKVGDEFYFGPYFQVFGGLVMDTTYPSIRGANATIASMIALDGGKYLIGGSFSNYDNANIAGGTNAVARVNADGTMDKTFANGYFTGPLGYVNTMAYLKNEQRILVAGNFSRYAQIELVYSIARLNMNGTLDSVNISTPSQNVVRASALAGGFRGTISEMAVQPDGKIIVSGGFKYYVKPNYQLVSVSGQDSVHLDSTRVNNLARINADGSLDSSFNYDLTNHQGLESVNGGIYRTILLPGGKIIIAGNFTTYNGQQAVRIARLNPDGTLDAGFNAGAGADFAVNDVVVQPDGKMVLLGNFNRYNGVKAMRAVRINADGSHDPSFSTGDGPNGNLARGAVIPGTGNIILTGAFSSYAGVMRNNFVTVNSDGTIHTTYNSNGGIIVNSGGTSAGIVANIIPAQNNEKALFVVGSFTMFDYRAANRIVKMKYQ